MAVSVQLVSRAASEKLLMKYSDLSGSSDTAEGPEPKRLSLQSFLLSNYANSPRRRLSVEEFGDSQSPTSHVSEPHRQSADYYSNPNEEAFIISRLGTMVPSRSIFAPAGSKKSGPSIPSTTYKTLSLKYKLLYLCGVSNIDMVDKYVTLPR